MSTEEPGRIRWELVRLAGGEIPSDDAFAAAAQLRELVRDAAERDAVVAGETPVEEREPGPDAPSCPS